MLTNRSIISCLLAVILLISVCSMASFALVPEEKFNIDNITWEEIMTMSNSDFRKLLFEFERVYDPFETYETNQITQNESDWIYALTMLADSVYEVRLNKNIGTIVHESAVAGKGYSDLVDSIFSKKH